MKKQASKILILEVELIDRNVSTHANFRAKTDNTPTSGKSEGPIRLKEWVGWEGALFIEDEGKKNKP